MHRTAIVTGGSSGIGRAAAVKLRDEGYRVYEFSRTGRSEYGIRHCTVDVTDEALVRETVRRIFRRELKIDLLINCAGFGISGACEFTEHEDAVRQIDVNLFGIANVSKAVLPYMKKRGWGRIINISSVAAVMPIPFQVWYSVSKSGINAYTCGLANEVRQFGITVCAVMFGDVHTGFTDARKKSERGDFEYGGRISRSVGRMEADENGGYTDNNSEFILSYITFMNTFCEIIIYKVIIILTSCTYARVNTSITIRNRFRAFCIKCIIYFINSFIIY